LSESKPKGLTGICRSWRTTGKASAPCNGFWPPYRPPSTVRVRFGPGRGALAPGRWDATIGGQVFCSFLALVLLDELQQRLADRGRHFEWADMRRDLLAIAEVEVRHGDQWYLLRTALQGVAGKICQAVGVSLPSPVRTLENVVPTITTSFSSEKTGR
jgi:hypothetical protein